MSSGLLQLAHSHICDYILTLISCIFLFSITYSFLFYLFLFLFSILFLFIFYLFLFLFYFYLFYFYFLFWASLVAQRLKRLPGIQETWVRSLGRENPLEKEMATHSSTLAWRIPWREETGRLQSMGSQILFYFYLFYITYSFSFIVGIFSMYKNLKKYSVSHILQQHQ